MGVKFLLQIYHEAKKFGKVYNINVVCAYGGGSMWEQTKACQEGAEIIVATPVSTHVLLKISSFCLFWLQEPLCWYALIQFVKCPDKDKSRESYFICEKLILLHE